MTFRQKILYKQLKHKVKGSNIGKSLQAKNKLENLMNLVMQLRKVCNHPELLKPKESHSPFKMISAEDHDRPCLEMTMTGQNTTTPQKEKLVFVSNYNPIKYHLPKSLYDECFGLWK